MSLLEHDYLPVPRVSDVSDSIPADVKDEMFLTCALDGQANFIISGDQHLLDLGTYLEIPILTVQKFLERLE